MRDVDIAVRVHLGRRTRSSGVFGKFGDVVHLPGSSAEGASHRCATPSLTSSPLVKAGLVEIVAACPEDQASAGIPRIMELASCKYLRSTIYNLLALRLEFAAADRTIILDRLAIAVQCSTTTT